MSAIFGAKGCVKKNAPKLMSSSLSHNGSYQAVGHSKDAFVGIVSSSSKALFKTLTYEQNNYDFVFVGAITNLNFLKSRVENFRSEDLADLFIRLYVKYGKNFPEFIEGPFAFSISDGKRVYIARDSLGLCPLYYCYDESVFLFSSEIKSILSNLSRDPTINFEALCQRFVFGDHLLDITTYLAEIQQLPKGNYLLVSEIPKREGLDIECQAYGKLKKSKFEGDSTELLEEIAQKVEGNVKHYVRQYDSIGILLSGGFDSSVLAALAVKNSTKKIKTFTISDDPNYPDVLQARRVAQHLGTDHREIIVSHEKSLHRLAQGIHAYEDLIFRDTLFNLAAEINGAVDVVISGAGADFFGLPSLMPKKLSVFSERWQRLLVLSNNEVLKSPLGAYMTVFLKGLQECSDETANSHFTNSYFPNQLVPSTVKAMGYFKMESFFPYIDQELILLAERMPVELKFDGVDDKIGLRQAFVDLNLPEEILQRPSLCSKENLLVSKMKKQEYFKGKADSAMHSDFDALLSNSYLRECFSLYEAMFIRGKKPNEFKYAYN